ASPFLPVQSPYREALARTATSAVSLGSWILSRLMFSSPLRLPSFSALTPPSKYFRSPIAHPVNSQAFCCSSSEVELLWGPNQIFLSKRSPSSFPIDPYP